VTRTKLPGRGWAYTGAVLGGLVSIAANVAHSFLPPYGSAPDWEPEPGAVVGAIVWPVFLFIAVEILARTAWPHGLSWHLLRWAGLLPVAGVAAFVSYRHLSGLLQHYGEEPIVYVIGPLAVDGLMIMATGALIAGVRASRASKLAPVHVPMPVAVASTVETPAAAPSPLQVKQRVDARRHAETTTAKPNGSATDIPVTAPDIATPKPAIAAGQLARARHVAEAHQKVTGAAITPGELAVRLRINSDRANHLLAALATG
jgi:hypothetical protein